MQFSILMALKEDDESLIISAMSDRMLKLKENM